jgi:N-acetyl-1-D-myo-inositol-2-amino-2-deoxy-alpha-D-glucopyranoside deacetylase
LGLSDERRLLAVHAHPDDESITTGGLLARCAGLGIRTRLVTCTDGRRGPVNPELGLTLTPDQLVQARWSELRAAASILGVTEVDWLGYHDSGMAGSPDNTAPGSFWSQPCDRLVGQMTGILRRFRPHVVVTYDAFGFTGHPDHIQTHRVVLLGVEAAAEPRLVPSEGAAWSVGRIFHPVFPVSAFDRFVADEIRASRGHPFANLSATQVNYICLDQLVTHTVDIRDHYERKRLALSAHRTQIGPHNPLLARAALARREREHFRLALERSMLADFGDVFEPAECTA